MPNALLIYPRNTAYCSLELCIFYYCVYCAFFDVTDTSVRKDNTLILFSCHDADSHLVVLGWTLRFYWGCWSMDHILDSKAFEQRVCSIVFIFLPHPQFLAIADLFTIPIILPFPECCINRIIQYVAFQTGFFHVACVDALFIFFYSWITFHPMDRPHFVFIHLSVDGRLGWFHLLATVNIAAVRVLVFIWIPSFIFLG